MAQACGFHLYVYLISCDGEKEFSSSWILCQTVDVKIELNTVDIQIHFIHVLTLTYRLDIRTLRDIKAATIDHFILTADQMALCV